MSIFAKTQPTDEIAAARSRVQQIETQRHSLWAVFQAHLARADELQSERADLLLKGDTIDLKRNAANTEEALLLAQTNYADYAALAAPQLAAESAVRGALGRRAPTRAYEIADAYAEHIARIADHAEAARDHAESMARLEEEAETLYRNHGETIRALPLGRGAVSLRSAIETHLLEPLMQHSDAVARNRADAELAAAANSKWQADRARARAAWTGDQDAFGIESPSFPDGTVAWTEVEDEHGRRRLYKENKE
jgi:hypothetical protein